MATPHWLAWQLPPCEAPDPGVPTAARGWWALGFTPCVAILEEALVLEVSGTLRLWGGLPALRTRLHHAAPGAPDVRCWAEGATAQQALALLRLQLRDRRRPACVPHDLPLDTLSALRPHAQALAHLGCRTWGALRSLPRAGVARRFGQDCLTAMDQAWGTQEQAWDWLQLPEAFDLQLELPAPVDSAPALLQYGQHLLDALQAWLRARQQGVLVLELAWQHALRRVDGQRLPDWQSLVLRTAEPLRDMAHLRRLLSERLARQVLAAPAGRLALRSRQTAPLHAGTRGLLPPAAGVDDCPPGEPWHQLLERLAARLGAASLHTPELHADHRPERMQRWHMPALAQPHRPLSAAARRMPPSSGAPVQAGGSASDDGACGNKRAALWPGWLVRPPQALRLQGDRPLLHDQPLVLLAGPERIEAGWWEPHGGEHGQGLARRDYFVAHNALAGWVWIFRDRASGAWFLHGVYA
ncbi:protein ImuB [Oryzisolibacter propanilivorax]|uniref:Protein ImuB n=1 Tax=Oryzisolibacter propanilivorax TaxID=1527607 RepID=A0A1G9P8R2_9BURK|nr:DNA polymerase Y family protein [Oryzisolibacter propanilivorax]SDL95150.1 protein ImuB [Oryzisolibacter propanilivorax]